MIYLITNIQNGKRYIGKTIDIHRRWSQHTSKARTGSNTLLHKAIRKYGAGNFTVEILQETSDDSNRDEIRWIQTLLPEYNLTTGGDGGDTSRSPNYQEGMKRRRSFAGPNNNMFGKLGINNPNYGKRYESSEARTQACLDGWNNHERRAKASVRMIGNKNGFNNKKQAKRILIDGVIYPSIGQAATALGYTHYFVKKHGEFIGD